MSAGQGREWALVATGFVLLALVAAVWLAIDRSPPEWDHANHLERALRCAEDLTRGDPGAILARSSFYPPLVPCAAGVAYRLAPSDVAAAQAVVLAFLALGMAATYLLGRDASGGTAGVVAALAFGAAPFVVFSSLRFALDLPLAAVTAATLWALSRSAGFARRGWSTAAGLLAGLGLLTKPTFALYALPGLALAAARIRGGRALFHALVAAALAGGLAAPWYGPRLLGFLPQLSARSFAQAAESGFPDPWTGAALTFYLRWLPTMLGVATTVFLGVGLVVATRRRQGWLVLSFLLPWGPLLFVQNKNLRYALPLLPLAAVLAGVGVAALRGRARGAAAVAIVAVGVLQVAATVTGATRGMALPLAGTPVVLDSVPARADWRHREILALIAQDSAGEAARVSVVPNHGHFSVSNFRYYARRDGLALRFTRAWEGEPIGVDYMILKTGHVGPSWTAARPRRIRERLDADRDLARVYPVLGDFPLPDGSRATVRVRRLPPAVAVAPATLARRAVEALRRDLARVSRDVEGLEIRVDHDDRILSGRLRRLTLRAAAATVGELTRRDAATLRVRDLTVVAGDVVVNPWSLADGHLALLDAGYVRLVQATIEAEALEEFLARQRGLRRAIIRLEEGALGFRFGLPGPDVSGRVSLLPGEDGPLALAARDVRVGGVRVPDLLVGAVMRSFDPTPRLAARLPVPVRIGRIEVTPTALRIRDD